VDSSFLDEIAARKEALGDAAPRFALFLFEFSDAEAIRRTVSRMPQELDPWLDEIVVMLDGPASRGLPASGELVGARPLTLRLHRPPRDSGFGAARKAAFEYALLRGFDHAIFMRGDGSQPPEKLPELVCAALDDPRRLLLATRRAQSHAPTPRALAHRASTVVQNRTLGLSLTDYHASFRIYPMEAMKRIPVQLNSNDSTFDVEVMLQFRALGVAIAELPILPGTRGDGGGSDQLAHSFAACLRAFGYRLHQVHATRDGRYIVDHDVQYTLKLSNTSSHMQIVSAISPDTSVLDLGCSQGLLARPLKEKKVEVTGVDVSAGDRLASELTGYYQRDLEEPLDIPEERVFDYVVCADVIEHVQNRAQLLRGARRYLKPEGRLIISTPNIALWFYRLSLLAGRFEYGPRGVLDETHVHLFTGATFRREVERAGFHVLRERVTALPFEVVFESTGRSRFVRGLASTYHTLARLWPSMFAYQFVLEAEITTLDEESTEHA